MFSYEFYKITHMFGVMNLFMGLGLLLVAFSLSDEAAKKKFKKWGAIQHGVGLLIMLVSGFGLAARLGFMAGLPAFIHVKLVIWLLIGAGLVLLKRKPQLGLMNMAIFLLLGLAAAYLGVFKMAAF